MFIEEEDEELEIIKIDFKVWKNNYKCIVENQIFYICLFSI